MTKEKLYTTGMLGRMFNLKRVTVTRRCSGVRGKDRWGAEKINTIDGKKVYPIEIKIKRNSNYEVWLVGNIHKIDDKKFPHHYEIDKEDNRVCLCLYHPKKFECNRGTNISQTLIPWTCEWLFYYELWLGNGVWYGGGEHPEV